jgi:hypothetical protein
MVKKRNTENDVVNNANCERDCKKLIKILYDVLEIYRGEHFAYYSKEQYAHAITNKFLNHAYTILLLTKYEKETNQPCSPVEISMLASIDVLVRASLEAYLTFHYLFIERTTVEEMKFRYDRYVFSGYLERLSKIDKVRLYDYRYMVILGNDRRTTNRLRRNLKTNSQFQKLEVKEQDKILNGKWRDSSWTEMALKAGLSKNISTFIYSYLCGYAHSGSLSVRQLQIIHSIGQQSNSIDSVVLLLNVCIAKMINAYCVVFPLAKSYLDKPNVKEFVNLWEKLANMEQG